MTINNVFLEFIAEKRMYCSDKTIEYYYSTVTNFITYLGEDITIESITRNMVSDYVIALRKTGIKNVSVNTKIRGIRTFLNWCMENSYTSENFSRELKYLKSDNRNIFPLYQEEVKVIDSYFDTSTVLGLRNYCIFHLMLDVGLRRSEVIRYSKDSFYQGKNIISVLGKGNKYRLVPVPEHLKDMLMRYHAFGCDRFLTLHSDAITVNTINMFFSRLKKQTGIDRLYPHLLRHTFATSYMLGGGNLEFLRLMMGHSDYEVTKNYLHLANQFQLLGADIYKLDSVFFKNYYNV